ncbi:hypothetical protein [Lysinibacillus sp. RC79]|uniref:hypothetical protein n=1 Tax=Lysinibacillus sp. RC79 TaxID=3156296 RepID=UPI003511ECAB
MENFECPCGYTGNVNDALRRDDKNMKKNQIRSYILCPNCGGENTIWVEDKLTEKYAREQEKLSKKWQKLNQERILRMESLKAEYLESKEK